jgi:hypothetical protein
VRAALALTLLAAGIGQLVLGLGHVPLPRWLGWEADAELLTTSPVNRSVSYVHTFFVGLVVAALGLLDIVFRFELLADPRLGRAMIGFVAVFWLARLLAQVTVFKPAMHLLPFHPWLHRSGVAAWTILTLAHGAAFAFNVAN